MTSCKRLSLRCQRNQVWAWRERNGASGEERAECSELVGVQGTPTIQKLMRKGGLEPPRYCYRQPLKLVRLPIPPLPREGGLDDGLYFERAATVRRCGAGGCGAGAGVVGAGVCAPVPSARAGAGAVTGSRGGASAPEPAASAIRARAGR